MQIQKGDLRMLKLTRQYLKDHIEGDISSANQTDDTPENFTRSLTDQILALAMHQFDTDSMEVDEIHLSIPVTIRPVNLEPLPCTEICLRVGSIQICQHKIVRANKPN
jgi:hypothetical protein